VLSSTPPPKGSRFRAHLKYLENIYNRFQALLKYRFRLHFLKNLVGLTNIYAKISVADPDPNPLVRGMDPVAPDPGKNLDSYCFVTSF
jgi:hypothetical protein